MFCHIASVTCIFYFYIQIAPKTASSRPRLGISNDFGISSKSGKQITYLRLEKFYYVFDSLNRLFRSRDSIKH